MMLKELREQVYEANMGMPKHGLVVFTWGNGLGGGPTGPVRDWPPPGWTTASSRPRAWSCDLDGNVVEGDLNPSSDTPTHAYLYRQWDNIGGIVHAHPPRPWPGRRRALHPVLRHHAGRLLLRRGALHEGLTEDEIEGDYSLNTGKVIVRASAASTLSRTPAASCATTALLVGADAAQAVLLRGGDRGGRQDGARHRAALHGGRQALDEARAPQYLLDKHYMRKHGPNAYYGQKKN